MAATTGDDSTSVVNQINSHRPKRTKEGWECVPGADWLQKPRKLNTNNNLKILIKDVYREVPLSFVLWHLALRWVL